MANSDLETQRAIYVSIIIGALVFGTCFRRYFLCEDSERCRLSVPQVLRSVSTCSLSFTCSRSQIKSGDISISSLAPSSYFSVPSGVEPIFSSDNSCGFSILTIQAALQHTSLTIPRTGMKYGVPAPSLSPISWEISFWWVRMCILTNKCLKWLQTQLYRCYIIYNSNIRVVGFPFLVLLTSTGQPIWDWQVITLLTLCSSYGHYYDFPKCGTGGINTVLRSSY